MFGIKELVIILIVVLLVFGTKKLRNAGGDLGGAIKNFKQAMKEGEESETPPQSQAKDGRVIDAEAKPVDEKDDV